MIAMILVIGFVQGVAFLPVIFRIGGFVETRLSESSDRVRGGVWLLLVIVWILACLVVPVLLWSPIAAGSLAPDAPLDQGDLWLISLFGGMLLYTYGGKAIAKWRSGRRVSDRRRREALRRG